MSDRIVCSGIYGLESRVPLVQLEIPVKLLHPVLEGSPDGPVQKDDFTCVQLHVDEARSIAMNLLEVAEAALGDGFLLTFLEHEIGLSLQELAPLLLKFRGYRAKQSLEGA